MSEDKAQELTPERAFELLQLWYHDTKQLAELKQAERFSRDRLSAFYFPKPAVGTNRVDIGMGFDLKLVHKYNYSVDEEELDNVKATDIKKLKLPWDDLFVYKPELHMKTYNSLTAEQKLFVDQLLTIKPASPALEIVPAANREAQQAHVEQATKAAANEPSYDVVLAAEDAEPGKFFFDGENWWQLNSEMEWDEVPTDNDEFMAQLEGALAAATAAAAAAKPKRGRKKKDT